MWSSSSRSLAALALVGACANPEVVIDVTNVPGGELHVYSCNPGALESDTANCSMFFSVAANQSVGIYTSVPAIRVIFQFSSYCQQLDLSLAVTPVDITYSPMATADEAALASCAPMSACLAPLAPCATMTASAP